jgi:RIO kinase 1
MRINEILSELLTRYSNIEYIKEIRSGKEASVHLVKTDGIFYALKVYKENQKYSTKTDYLQIKEIGDSRTARAVKNKSKRGVASLNSMWTSREFKIMRMMSEQTSNVPNVILNGSDYILMEFVGDGLVPAPRLNEVTLNMEEANRFFFEIVDCIKLFIQNGFVHGDLSAYNILVHNNHPIIIDFPQVLNISNNPNAFGKLKIDLDNIQKFFAVLGIPNLDTHIADIYETFELKRVYG